MYRSRKKPINICETVDYIVISRAKLKGQFIIKRTFVINIELKTLATVF